MICTSVDDIVPIGVLYYCSHVASKTLLLDCRHMMDRVFAF